MNKLIEKLNISYGTYQELKAFVYYIALLGFAVLLFTVLDRI